MRHAPFPVLRQESDPSTLSDLFSGAKNLQRHAPGHAIVVEGDPVTHLFQVVAGTVRSCSFTEQGRRQIFRFARAGDIFGLIDIDHWHYTAEAVDAVILRSISKQAFDNALDGSRALRRDLRMRVGDLTAERERHLTFLAFESAEQRLGWFLRNFSAGRADDGFLTLPMTRQEIGDYLGLSLETVSRAFGSLKRAGVIEMRGAEKYRLVAQQSKIAA
ncbi:Crp/Fnr family transcriptional regulator [Pikeienuella piscinae]|uniref:Crp/Fnr family transcriptional regulator n=1 Tax=Pikeienuella piscinae TaxID=2748098 RepID=A0A7L5BTQ9_9RHOB|nr:Crp/Fnr family transcriptional regulator [Pikeienuella piscinae]QIE54203.1 Crp/Fnr family transcriptional regulator [Pikeienuella piscinae]